jgi:ketosteroid isomerase-like protein
MTVPSSADAIPLIDALYAAFNRRDIDAVLTHLSPDVVWPNGWEGGVVRGREAVRDYWTRQWAAIDPSVTPTAVRVDVDGAVVVDVRQVVKDLDGGVRSDDTVQHVYVFVDGLARSMEIRRSD